MPNGRLSPLLLFDSPDLSLPGPGRIEWLFTVALFSVISLTSMW